MTAEARGPKHQDTGGQSSKTIRQQRPEVKNINAPEARGLEYYDIRD